MTAKKKNLIIDGNNIIHRTFHANNRSGEPADVIIGLCVHSALTTMNYYFNKFKVDDIVITFDSHSWRKEYTKDLSKCVTNKKYKGHRTDDMTPKQLEMRRMLVDHIDDLCEMLTLHSRIIVLRGEYLEGDDLIAGYIQMHRNEDHVIISGDKDMMQLLRYEGVALIDPATGNERTLEEYENNADLFLYEKCIRGEGKKGDNIQSSYPRLRKDRMFKSFHDEYERSNVMNHKFTQLEAVGDDYEEVEYTTRELFEENQLLMNLTKQPKKIKIRMVRTIEEAIKNRGKYDHFSFIRYCKRNELDKIRETIEQFVPMMAVKPGK
jgi:hypothetical protein